MTKKNNDKPTHWTCGMIDKMTETRTRTSTILDTSYSVLTTFFILNTFFCVICCHGQVEQSNRRGIHARTTKLLVILFTLQDELGDTKTDESSTLSCTQIRSPEETRLPCGCSRADSAFRSLMGMRFLSVPPKSPHYQPRRRCSTHPSTIPIQNCPQPDNPIYAGSKGTAHPRSSEVSAV